jgi:polyphenol oxidase
MISSHTPGPGALVERGGLPVLVWSIFADQPIDVVVTTRGGGVSGGPYASLNLGLHVGDDPEHVIENRSRAAAAIGLELDELVFCNQAHGRTVARVDEGDRGRGARTPETAVPGADALITRSPDVGLVVMMADCVPIVLYDPVRASLACIHAGWRGTVARVVTETVGQLVAEGSRAQDLLAGIGPAIPAERYQVGPEVQLAAREQLGEDADEVVVPDGHGRWRFDLWEANRRLLRHAGVPEANIELAAIPTGDDGPFFSDRAVRPCGRFAALARVRADRRAPTEDLR